MESRKDMIIIHCSDTPHSIRVDVGMIRRWHTDPKPNGNGWADIGYAYYIDQLGDLHRCRDLDGDENVEDEVGAHAYGFNNRSIGICMEGRDEFTEYQFATLRFLITDIASRHGIKESNIIGHRDVDPGKSCPGFIVQDKLEEWK